MRLEHATLRSRVKHSTTEPLRSLISKEPAQTCYGCEGDSWRGGCSAASALVCDMMIDMPPKIKRKFIPRPKVWKLRDPQTCSRFKEVFKAHMPAVETEAATTTEEIWAKLKTGLLKTTEVVCGTTKPH